MFLPERLGSRATPVVTLEQVQFGSTHARGLLGLCVIVSEDVKNPVNHQQRKFVVKVPSVIGCLVSGHRRADDYVTKEERQVRCIWF